MPDNRVETVRIRIYFSCVGSSLRWGSAKAICSEVRKTPLHISHRLHPVKFFYNNFTLYLFNIFMRVLNKWSSQDGRMNRWMWLPVLKTLWLWTVSREQKRYNADNRRSYSHRTLFLSCVCMYISKYRILETSSFKKCSL